MSLRRGLPPLSFYTDAKADLDSAWIGGRGGFLEVEGRRGPWYSLKVRWIGLGTYAKGDPKKVIAALELLATLVAIRLWVPEGEERKSSRVAIRGYTDNKSNEALLKKAMTMKYPSMLILMWRWLKS